MARTLRRRVPRMDTAPLGPFTVSRLCLGTMLMGAKTPVEESHRMLDRFLEAGGNFIDTADTYDDGGSEETLAPWLADHRDDVVLATKVRFAVSDPGGEGLEPGPHPQGLRRQPAPARRRRDRPLPGPRARSRRAAGGDARGARRARAGRQGPRARRLELPGLAARLGGRAAGPPRLVAVRLAAAAVLARRALDRDRDPAVLPRRRARRAPVGAARRGLPHRPLLARRAAARGLAHGRGRRRPRGGARAARDRAQLPRRRRGAGDRGGEGRDGLAGRAGVAAGHARA